MYSCPACGAEDVANLSTCRCGADLSLLQRLDAVADAWFNRALEALANNNPGHALEWLSASCAARPTDVAARRAQAKVWAQLGHWAEARDALSRARDIEPDDPELAEIELALQDIEHPGNPISIVAEKAQAQEEFGSQGNAALARVRLASRRNLWIKLLLVLIWELHSRRLHT
jgi:predicted Zn-dependent protease